MGLEASATRMVTRAELLEEVVALTVGMLVAFEISRQLFRWEPEAKVPGKAKLWVIVALIPFLSFGIYESAFGHQLSRIHQHFEMLDQQDARGAPR